MPNTRGESRPEAEARNERKLEGVGSSAMLGGADQITFVSVRSPTTFSELSGSWDQQLLIASRFAV